MLSQCQQCQTSLSNPTWPEGRSSCPWACPNAPLRLVQPRLCASSPGSLLSAAQPGPCQQRVNQAEVQFVMRPCDSNPASIKRHAGGKCPQPRICEHADLKGCPQAHRPTRKDSWLMLTSAASSGYKQVASVVKQHSCTCMPCCLMASSRASPLGSGRLAASATRASTVSWASIRLVPATDIHRQCQCMQVNLHLATCAVLVQTSG